MSERCRGTGQFVPADRDHGAAEASCPVCGKKVRDFARAGELKVPAHKADWPVEEFEERDANREPPTEYLSRLETSRPFRTNDPTAFMPNVEPGDYVYWIERNGDLMEGMVTRRTAKTLYVLVNSQIRQFDRIVARARSLASSPAGIQSYAHEPVEEAE